MVGKSFLVQKFAKLKLGSLHLIGYSVAGEESVVQDRKSTRLNSSHP